MSANIIDGFVKSLEEASTKLFKSSSDNVTKCNADKCHFLVNIVKIREKNCTSKCNTIYNILERPITMNTFFKKSQFSYCSLVWIRHTRAHHIKINRLHKLINRLQVLIYFDEASSFDALLENDGSFSIHNINLELLPIQMYKDSKGRPLPVKSEL